jgi:WD40 repeat protein
MNDPDASAPFLSVPAAVSAARQTAPENRYVDVGLLGTGGMGEVRAVHDAALGRQIARKSPRADVPGAADALAREAAVTATLEHPGIVAVYDAGEDADGTPWYTMRLIRGRTLRAVIDATPTLAARMALLRPVLATVEAVAYAHDRGIVHCDLKTANVLVGEHGEVQVVDWGLAGPSPNPASGGTPATMAPEQVRGEATTPESDVWGLGLILREVLTGESVRAGSDRSRSLAGVGTDLAAIVRRCLQPEPSARYANAGAMAADLARFLDGQLVNAHRYTTVERVSRVVRKHQLAVGIALLFTVVLIAVATTAAVRVVGERQTAVAAEHLAVQALQQSDEHLAQALSLASRTAAAKGMRPEAEVLAAGVLSLKPSAVARGILAATGASPPPRRAPVDLVPCTGTRHPTAFGWACARADSVVLPGPLGAVVDVAARDVASAGEHLVVTVDGNMALVIDPVTGQQVGEIVDLPTTVGVESGSVFAWQAAGHQLARLDPVHAQRVLFDVCGAGVVVAGVEELTDGSLAVICGQQSVVRFTSPTSLGQPLDIDLRDPQATARVLAGGPYGVVAVGTDRGHVIVVSPTGRRFETHLETPVNQLRWTADGRRLVVSVSGGSPILIDATSGARLGRLPMQDRAVVGMSGPSGVIIDRVGGLRWDVDKLVPSTIGAGAGITGLVLGSDHDVLVIRGDGAVDRYDLHTGEVLGHTRWSTRPLKGITELPDGDGYVVVGVEGGLHRLSSDLAQDVQLADIPGRRLVTVGRDLLVLRYGGPGTRLSMDDPMKTFIGQSGPTWFDAGTSPDRRKAAVLAEDGVLWRVPAQGPAQDGGQFPDASAVDVGDSGLVVLAEPDTIALVRPDGAVSRQPRKPGSLLDVALSPNERWVALAGLDGVVTVYDVDAGKVVAVLDGHTERVAVVVWASDHQLFSGSWDGTVRVWDLSRQDRPAEDLLAELTATWDLDVAGALQALDP